MGKKGDYPRQGPPVGSGQLQGSEPPRMRLGVASPVGGLMPPPKTSRGVRVSLDDEEEGSSRAVHAGRCWVPAPSRPGEGSRPADPRAALAMQSWEPLPALGDWTLLGRRCLWPLVQEQRCQASGQHQPLPHPARSAFGFGLCHVSAPHTVGAVFSGDSSACQDRRTPVTLVPWPGTCRAGSNRGNHTAVSIQPVPAPGLCRGRESPCHHATLTL